MISADTILTGFWSQLNSVTTLRSILGSTGRIIKGARRPENLLNPCVTIQMPVRVIPSEWYGSNQMVRTMTEPIMLSVFVDNFANGQVNVATLGTICANIHSIAATKPTITGATVHRVGQLSEAGPIYDPQDPHEAYQVISFGYWLSDTG